MEPDKLEHYLITALKEPEIRRACYALESIIRGGLVLDDLSPRCLELLQGRCEEYEKEQKGTEHEFKRAWMAMVAEHLADAKLRERRLYCGITGGGQRGRLSRPPQVRDQVSNVDRPAGLLGYEAGGVPIGLEDD